MPVIFSGQPGRVFTVRDPAVPADIRPLVQPNPTVTIQNEKSIITDITIAHQTSHQFLHTLGNDIFIYVFGDRMGQMQIRGLSFAERCEEIGSNPGDNAAFGLGEHGLGLMLRWYERNKLSERLEPVKITIGSNVITGFIQGMTTRVQDPKNWLVEYALNIAIIPKKSEDNLGAGGGGGGGGGGGSGEDESSPSDRPAAEAVPDNKDSDKVFTDGGAPVGGATATADGNTKLDRPPVAPSGTGTINSGTGEETGDRNPTRTPAQAVGAGTAADVADFDRRKALEAATALASGGLVGSGEG